MGYRPSSVMRGGLVRAQRLMCSANSSAERGGLGGGRGHAATAGVQVALADDPEEQLLERRRRVVHRHQLGAVAGDHCRGSPASAASGRSRVLIWVTSWTVSRSETLPISLSSPRWRIAIRSQMSCMSASRWPGQHDRLALFAELADQVLDLGRADRVEARGRLVEQDQLGVVDQRLGQADPALHALGVLAELAVLGGAQADHVDQPVDPLGPLGRRDLEQPAVEVERLLGVQELVEVRLLGQVADPLVLGDVGRRLVEDQRVALGREEQAEQELDRGRLARAVGPEQAEDLAPVDLEVERLERLDLRASPEVAVDLGQVPCLDNDVTAHHAGALCKTDEGRFRRQRSDGASLDRRPNLRDRSRGLMRERISKDEGESRVSGRTARHSRARASATPWDLLEAAGSPRNRGPDELGTVERYDAGPERFGGIERFFSGSALSILGRDEDAGPGTQDVRGRDPRRRHRKATAGSLARSRQPVFAGRRGPSPRVPGRAGGLRSGRQPRARPRGPAAPRRSR